MKDQLHLVYIRTDFAQNKITDPLGPFVQESNIGGSDSLVIECNDMDLSHFKYAELSARFMDDKFIKLRIPHDIIFMILSAEERQDLAFGFGQLPKTD